MNRQPLLITTGLLLLAGLGCGVIGTVDNPSSLSGVNYWAAATGTAVPTVTIFLGTTTPVYADTPIPNAMTTTPDWTTVTATPISPPATSTPIGFTATPFWVTTTPITITETPPPPVITTPSLPIIGYSTPEPLETPYYRIGTFYINSEVYLGGPNTFSFRLVDHQAQPSPRTEDATYHFFTLQVRNYSEGDITLPISDLFFIRRIQQDGGSLTGRWVPKNEPLIAAGLPPYETQQLQPIPPDGEQDFILGFVTPNGDVPELGLITHWDLPIEGGLPVWFHLEPDPLGPFTDALQPPPPTPIILW